MNIRTRIALQLERLRRRNLKELHPLQQLFWESTLRCNVHCLHCGSDCVASVETPDMPAEDFLRVIDTEVLPHVDPHKVMIIISGGEPLMRKDLTDIGKALMQRGFPWGMVTNGLAMTEKRFRELRNAGLRSITVSLDGLEKDHVWLRQHPQAFEGACRTIRLCAAEPKLVWDVVTCANQRNIGHLPAIREMLWEMGVRSWRVFGIDPMGRAADNPELLLDDKQFKQLMDFIAAEREAGRPVSYACEGYLGDYEGRVRDYLYHCAAGVSIASILIDGSISACTSIRGKYYQGNIYKDSFWQVWENGFKPYRDRSWMRHTEPCKDCKAFSFCEGNGMHLRREDGSLMVCHLKKIQKTIATLAVPIVMIMTNACTPTPSALPKEAVNQLQHEMLQVSPEADSLLLYRGIEQAAALWTPEDGTAEEFAAFVRDNYATTPEARQALFASLSRIIEKCYQSADMLTVDLLKPTQLTNTDEPQTPDWIMSGYSPLAHFSDDMFANKMAFLTILNFPHFSLEEKNTMGRIWTREQYAMARLGDIFTTRVPAEIKARLAQANADAENYIADYNIYMGNLRTDDGRQLWPEETVLLAHWNLRDELKARYADKLGGQERQEMIYQVMQRIVDQSIPEVVINLDKSLWKPCINTVETSSGTNAHPAAEPYTRYERILGVAHALFEEDQYCPTAPTGIIRNFEEGVELPSAELDSLFRALVGSEQVKQVAAIIRERLGRDLMPYDIWYDGFKARASLNEDDLTATTRMLYPDANAFAADMPRLLQRLGFYSEDARNIAHHIVVEPARGSGHAWPCMGREEPSRLRTRIAATGMDYKGYNIAVHEFGHCVEQVLDMYYIDYYMLSGVPNTAYTEASAFLWQQRDLQLLPSANGQIANRQTRDAIFDQFWSMYEIMGVSLVDMTMWQWIYAHPDATAKQLCEATQQIAKNIWNTYYEPVLGEHDCILLAIYSHMVNAPMYLPNYPLGHIVQYQLEEHLANCATQRDFAQEYARIYRLGRLTPKEWMMQAVGAPPSVEPILHSVSRCLKDN